MHSWGMNIKVRAKECPLIYGHIEKDTHDPLTSASQWKTIGKDRCSLSWIYQGEAMYLPSYQDSHQIKLIWEKIWVQEKTDFNHKIKGPSANGWIERLNHSYPTLSVLVFQHDGQGFLASRAISHRESAEQYELHEQTLDWSTEFSK